jgi:plasmid stabilization system protein ParE
MNYSVEISPEAMLELDEAYQWLASQTPQHAPEWHDALLDAIISLESNPERYPVVQQDEESSEAFRQLLFGNKRHAYRILFVIRGQQVWVGHIRHAARHS